MGDNWCETHSGLQFDFVDTTEEMLDIDDICYALAREGRYANQSFGTITVAEHSCHVCDILSPGLRAHGLMHDASEYMLRDIPKPLKMLLLKYEEIEDRIQGLVYEKFCGGRLGQNQERDLKYADKSVMKAEATAWMHNGCDHWGCLVDVEVAKVRIEKWAPGRSEVEFMRRFMQYCCKEGE